MSTCDTSNLSSSIEPIVEDRERENALISNLVDRYKDKLTTFPRTKGWVFGTLYMYQGFWYLSQHKLSIETLLALQDTFHARPTDIYVATLPKSGTTWLKALVFATVNRIRYKNNSLSAHTLSISNPHKCAPFIETELFRDTPTFVDEHFPRLLSTHTCYTSLPQPIIDCGCRVVYMCRNPKDVLVSLFHFVNKLRNKSQQPQIEMDEAFEMFAKGSVAYGPYWDHVKGYYKASLEHPTRILFLTYEGMKRDTPSGVKRVAEFLGVPFTKEEEAHGFVDDIVISKRDSLPSLSLSICRISKRDSLPSLSLSICRIDLVSYFLGMLVSLFWLYIWLVFSANGHTKILDYSIFINCEAMQFTKYEGSR